MRTCKVVIFALILALCLILNFMWLSEHRYRTRYAAWYVSHDSLQIEHEDAKQYHEQTVQLQFHYENRPITDFLMTDRSVKDTATTFYEWASTYLSALSDTLKGEEMPRILAFRYTELHCNTCTDRQIALLDQVRKRYPHTPCVIFTTYAYEAHFEQFKRMNQLQIPAFNVPQEALLGGVGVPFFFVLDGQMCYKNLFLPDKAHEAWTVDYLSALWE